MPANAKILAFAGSTRTASFNKKLVRIAADGAREEGADVTLIDLRDYPLPLFDGDLEANEGLPANARALKDVFLAHNGLMISAPEYNSSITAVLKNTIDWVSRPVPNEASLACFTDKLAVLMSASPGALGGLRGLVHVRAILGNIGVCVLPAQVAVVKAHEAFQPDGSLKDAKLQASVKNLGAKLAAVLKKMNA
ncbi:MAG TPA: NAD(P)H-dependent oxidoreductase [Pirellulales bacterium]|jgi:NAD(P)H-dependent FMN reductase|nr:NAD(P)H-dependent oxidoreductase [Pirellulales bacterium]